MTSPGCAPDPRTLARFLRDCGIQAWWALAAVRRPLLAWFLPLPRVWHWDIMHGSSPRDGELGFGNFATGIAGLTGALLLGLLRRSRSGEACGVAWCLATLAWTDCGLSLAHAADDDAPRRLLVWGGPVISAALAGWVLAGRVVRDWGGTTVARQLGRRVSGVAFGLAALGLWRLL